MANPNEPNWHDGEDNGSAAIWPGLTLETGQALLNCLCDLQKKNEKMQADIDELYARLCDLRELHANTGNMDMERRPE